MWCICRKLKNRGTNFPLWFHGHHDLGAQMAQTGSLLVLEDTSEWASRALFLWGIQVLPLSVLQLPESPGPHSVSLQPLTHFYVS